MINNIKHQFPAGCHQLGPERRTWTVNLDMATNMVEFIHLTGKLLLWAIRDILFLYHYISFIYHLYIIYISFIYHLYHLYIIYIYISFIYHLYIMYMSFIYHLYIIYISFMYHLYIIYISFIHHLYIIYIYHLYIWLIYIYIIYIYPYSHSNSFHRNIVDNIWGIPKIWVPPNHSLVFFRIFH